MRGYVFVMNIVHTCTYLKGCLSSCFDDHAGTSDNEMWIKFFSPHLADGSDYEWVVKMIGWPKGQQPDSPSLTDQSVSQLVDRSANTL